MGTLRPQPWTGQSGFTFRFEWGVAGLSAIADDAAVIIVVDVLRFSTAASIATEWGAPVSAGGSGSGVSPGTAEVKQAARRTVDDGDEPLFIGAEHGAALAVAALDTGLPVFAGSFRNASATAAEALASASGLPIAVIGAGEHWPDGTGRAATEDLLGAGAILRALDPDGSLTEPCCSPAARAARAAFIDAEPLLIDLLTATASGRQLWERGDGADVREAARLDINPVATRLVPPGPQSVRP